MTTLTAVPDLAAGTVTLTLVKTADVATLIRADVNGTRPVRTRAGTFPSAGAGTLTITDHEAALTGLVVYRAAGLEAWTSFAPGLLPRITLPFNPELTVPLDTVTVFNGSRPQSATVHEIIGREDPIVVSAGMKSRRGSLEVIFDDYRQAADVENMLKLGKTAMYRQSENPGQDFYFHPLTVEIEPDETCWKLSVGYVALRAPAGDRAAYGWTFAALAALPGATFASVATGYESFQTLTIGDPA